MKPCLNAATYAIIIPTMPMTIEKTAIILELTSRATLRQQKPLSKRPEPEPILIRVMYSTQIKSV